MRKITFFGRIVMAITLLMISLGASAGILFETHFLSSEGWVAEGVAANTGTLLSRTVTYNGNSFLFQNYQIAIAPVAANTTDCDGGKATIQKNGKTYPASVNVVSATGGYILLPQFSVPYQITMNVDAMSSDRAIAIEYSTDGGTTWLCNTDDVYNNSTGACAKFTSPTKFDPSTMKVRITNHSNGGGIVLRHLIISEFVSDLVPPTLVSSFPANDTTEISPSLQKMTLTFSENVKAGSGFATLYNLANSTMTQIASGTFSVVNNVVTIPFPASLHLDANTQYALVVDDGAIQDLAKNSSGQLTLLFTTKVVASSEKDIVSFTLPKTVSSVVNPATATVDITVAYGSNIATYTTANMQVAVSPFATINLITYDFTQGPGTFVVTAEDGTQKTWTVNVTTAPHVAAHVPVFYLGSANPANGWQNCAATGWSNNLTTADAVLTWNTISYTTATVAKASEFVQCEYDSPANQLSFLIRYGNATSNFQIDVQESPDGVTWTNVTTYKPSIDGTTITATNPDPAPMIVTASSSMSRRVLTLQPTSRFVRWNYTTRTVTSFYLDDVSIVYAPADAVNPTLASDPVTYANYSNKSQVIIPISEPLMPTPALTNRTTSITISVNGGAPVPYFEDNILCTRDNKLVLTNLPSLDTNATYTVHIPADALVDWAGNPFAGGDINFVAFATTGIVIPSAAEKAVFVAGDQLFLNDVEQAQVYSITGTLVKQIAHTSAASMSDVPKGIYIVKYTLKGGKIGSTKIVIR